MNQINRREFLKMGTGLAAMLGLGPMAGPSLASALEQMTASDAPVLWLQGQSCSGCSVSFLNTVYPGPADVLTRYISLWFHSTISAATGEVAMQVINQAIERGGYYLVVEGSVPGAMDHACRVGHEAFSEQVVRAAGASKAVIALGSCAAYGGIPAAQNNPTGAVSVPEFLAGKGVDKPIIRLPGCPTHPDWLVGTLAHVLSFGLPALDSEGRPKIFYGKLIHDTCPRFADYERENFAEHFGDEGCLFKLGCQGPITHADCTRRYWNRGVNSCIQAGAPCIGCAAPDFARNQNFPFYRKDEQS